MKRGNWEDSYVGVLVKWWRACTFHNQYCYILSEKKQATLVQVDVSRVKGVISKETLFNKRD